jgi:hypothetical protein
MSERGKQIIANMAAKLAPTQQNKILGAATLTMRGSVRRCGARVSPQTGSLSPDALMEFLHSQGLQPGLISAKGVAKQTRSLRTPRHRAVLRAVGPGC